MTALLNQNLGENFFGKCVDKGRGSAGKLPPALKGIIAGVRGGVNALGDSWVAREAGVESDKAIDPSLTGVMNGLRRAVESCALRQAELTAKMREFLEDESQIQSILPEGASLNEKQKRFIQNFIEKMLGTNARTGFAKYPTGVGKTWMIALLLAAAHQSGVEARSLVLSPRSNLNEQHRRQFERFRSTARFGSVNDSADVTIETYQLAAANAKLGSARFEENYDLIILDELHRGLGEGVINFLRKRYPNAIIIGFSATPYIGAIEARTAKSARHFFEVPIDSVSLPEACQDGDITPMRVVRIKTRENQFNGTEATDMELEGKMDKAERIRLAVRIARKIPPGEKAIVFATGVEHAQATASALSKAGLRAGVVHSKMKDEEREKTMRKFEKGEIQILCNADMLIEGFDDVEVNHAIILRLTKSLWLHEQMIGRACRLNPSKPNKIATIWDVVGQHSGQCTLHGLARHYGELSEMPPNGSILLSRRKPKGEPSSTHSKEGDGKEMGFDLSDLEGDLEVITVDSIDPVRVPLDADYFASVENVKRDLGAFATSAGVESSDFLIGGKSSGSVSNEHLNTKAVVSTGEMITLRTYLNAFIRTKDEDSGRNYLNAIKELLIFCGLPLPETMRTEAILKEHLNDMDVVKSELERIATEMGLPSPEFIRWDAKNRGQTVCVTGQTVTLEGLFIIIMQNDFFAGRGQNPKSDQSWKGLIELIFNKKPVFLLEGKEYFSREDILRRDGAAMAEAGIFRRDYEVVSKQKIDFCLGFISLEEYFGRLIGGKQFIPRDYSILLRAFEAHHEDSTKTLEECVRREEKLTTIAKERSQFAGMIDRADGAEKTKLIKNILLVLARKCNAIRNDSGKPRINPKKLRENIQQLDLGAMKISDFYVVRVKYEFRGEQIIRLMAYVLDISIEDPLNTLAIIDAGINELRDRTRSED